MGRTHACLRQHKEPQPSADEDSEESSSEYAQPSEGEDDEDSNTGDGPASEGEDGKEMSGEEKQPPQPQARTSASCIS